MHSKKTKPKVTRKQTDCRGRKTARGGGAISLAGVMGLLPRATLHAAAPSQSKKNKNKMTFSCNGRSNNGIVAARKPLNPLLVTASVYRRFRLARKKHNKTKQAKHDNAERGGAAAARLPPDRHGANICARLVGRVGRGAAVDFFARPAWRSKQPPPVSCVFFRNKPIIPPTPTPSIRGLIDVLRLPLSV